MTRKRDPHARNNAFCVRLSDVVLAEIEALKKEYSVSKSEIAARAIDYGLLEVKKDLAKQPD